MLRGIVIVISFLYRENGSVLLINATRYGVDTTQRHIHIKMEEKSTAADKEQKKAKTPKKNPTNNNNNYNNIKKKKKNVSSLAAASEQAKAPLQIH